MDNNFTYNLQVLGSNGWSSLGIFPDYNSIIKYIVAKRSVRGLKSTYRFISSLGTNWTAFKV